MGIDTMASNVNIANSFEFNTRAKRKGLSDVSNYCLGRRDRAIDSSLWLGNPNVGRIADNISATFACGDIPSRAKAVLIEFSCGNRRLRKKRCRSKTKLHHCSNHGKRLSACSLETPVGQDIKNEPNASSKIWQGGSCNPSATTRLSLYTICANLV